MNRLGIMLMALLIVWLSGWLFGADYPPPHVRDVSAAAWAVAAIVAVSMAAMVSTTGRGNR